MRNVIGPLIAAFAAVFLSLAAYAAPAVTLKPSVGPPTSKVLIEGAGFGAFAAIDVYFDTTHKCLTFADGAGKASCTITVPSDAPPQTHWVSMLQRNNGTGAQLSFTVRTDWTQFRGRNAARNGRNPFENTINLANVVDLDTLWTAPIGPLGTFSTPVVFAGKVYIWGRDAKLYCFNALTGATIAGFPKVLSGPSFSSPAVGNNNVYIGTGAPDNKLHAFNATTGAVIAGFPKQLTGAVNSPPSVALGNVYVGSSDGKLNAFNATTGATFGSFPKTLTGDVRASPTIAGGRVYIGNTLGQFYAFNALTGANLAGSPKTLGAIMSSAAVAGGVVYVTAGDRIQAFDDTFGSAAEGFPVSALSDISSSPAVGNGMLFAGSADGRFYALATSRAGSDWIIHFPRPIKGSPIIAGGLVIVNSSTALYALSAQTDLLRWGTGVKTGELASPAIVDGIVYLGSTNGNLYAFSVNGELPASALRGGALGIKPALSSLKPDAKLKPLRTRLD